MKKAPEIYRQRDGVKATDPDYGNNGVFIIPHPNISGYQFFCIISDGSGWEHASITLQKNTSKTRKQYPNKQNFKDIMNGGGGRQVRQIITIQEPVERCPTWAEMCFIKNIFWGPDEAVIQIHPKEADYINNHPFCLHLWRPTDQEIPVPDPILVGIKQLKPGDF